ncbi:TPD1 protein homolog 1-like [Gastrolobium bilobum]|uniref:TPD1 protein homolog 1-like n=1 Tax=Gastrolobium bilobum TaxID=150636 RepID=UPI002AB298D1|nr:TPD1 protein homolog 1-like [Gastrolobium bilobum]
MHSIYALPCFSATQMTLLNFFGFAVSDLPIHKEGERGADIEEMVFSTENRTEITSRKLLQFADYGNISRIGRACSKNYIRIYQSPMPPLPSGIPAYNVEITNMCPSDCSIANIHLHCGWFSSARLINPRVFKRLGYDDCLVNNGQALGAGRIISFQYATTFSYPLSVSSVVCL